MCLDVIRFKLLARRCVFYLLWTLFCWTYSKASYGSLSTTLQILILFRKIADSIQICSLLHHLICPRHALCHWNKMLLLSPYGNSLTSVLLQQLSDQGVINICC
jgi:hypothetical protein